MLPVRKCLQVLLRGKLLNATPTARGNPYATACLDAGVAALPASDRDELLARWRTLQEPAASRAVHRVARYGALRPTEGGKGPPQEVARAQARRFVTAGLAQVCILEREMAWHEEMSRNFAARLCNSEATSAVCCLCPGERTAAKCCADESSTPATPRRCF